MPASGPASTLASRCTPLSAHHTASARWRLPLRSPCGTCQCGVAMRRLLHGARYTAPFTWRKPRGVRLGAFLGYDLIRRLGPHRHPLRRASTSVGWLHAAPATRRLPRAARHTAPATRCPGLGALIGASFDANSQRSFQRPPCSAFFGSRLGFPSPRSSRCQRCEGA